MRNKKNKAPDRIEISPEEEKSLRERITNNQLTENDRHLLLSILTLLQWIQGQLSRTKLTIKRLKKLFGFSNESNSNNNDTDNSPPKNPPEQQEEENESSKEETSAENNSSPENNEQDTPSPQKKLLQWNTEQNHGRLSANDYTGCPIIEVPLENDVLRNGRCPHCLECNTPSKLMKQPPSVVVFLDSQPLITGNRYQLERVRCSVCQTYFTAPLPSDLQGRSKYSYGATSSITIHHYYAGMPFKRLEMIQKLQGVPLADSTQYDLMVEFYEGPVKLIIRVLRQCAANGVQFYLDDTNGRIIEQMLINKQAHSPKEKSAIHATALISEYQGHRIYLFVTNQQTAGKTFSSLLKARHVDEDFQTMSDASASNFDAVDDTLMARWIITLCLTHSRRKFHELFDPDVEDDVSFVIRTIGTVYHHERYCKQMKLSPQERLEYHQQHSQPMMEALRVWLTNCLKFKDVEPNSGLGYAIIYLLKRWCWLTQFYRVPGGKMDNNLCEIAIKVVIRYRNNSRFYATFYSAQLGDAMMSLLHTAAASEVNLFHYLTSIQEYGTDVETNPKAWLPWCYQQTILALQRKTETLLPAVIDSS